MWPFVLQHAHFTHSFLHRSHNLRSFGCLAGFPILMYVRHVQARFVTPFSMQKLGCNAELIVDEFGEKLLEELDYAQEARNIEARRDLCGKKSGFALVDLQWKWSSCPSIDNISIIRT
jgi:hypothetical protein